MTGNQTIQRLVPGVAIVTGLLIFAVTNSLYPDRSGIHAMIRWIGVGAIVVCIFGRTFCSFYMDGRNDLVTEGPYSVTRNPYYYFSMLGAGGVGAQTGSVVLGLIFGVMAWIVFYVWVLQEERTMAKRYGAAFASYKASVPRLLPNPFLWRDVATLTFPAPNVLRPLADTMLFLLSVPIAKTVGHLQDLGLLPVLLSLP